MPESPHRIILTSLAAMAAPFVAAWAIYYLNTPSLVRLVCEAGYGTVRCVRLYWLGH
jgi:hypothetical protein